MGSFSELYLNAQMQTPLALTGIKVSGRPPAQGIRLDWQTEGEANLLRYSVMKQNGAAWQTLGTVPAKNAATAAYSFTDTHPVAGKNLFQIRIPGQSGKETFSPVVTVLYSLQGSLAVYPNPTVNSLIVEGLSTGDVLILTDATGRTLFSQKATGIREQLSMEALPAGSYQLIVRRADGSQQAVPVIRL